jgi:uncharacterized membrane protein YvbJ
MLKKCPYCAEEIRQDAIKCKHCGTMFKKDLGNSLIESGRNMRKTGIGITCGCLLIIILIMLLSSCLI